MSIQSNAINAAYSQALAVAGRTVSYHRGNSSVVLTAALGKTSWDTDTEYGVITTESRDYIVSTSSLGLVPQKGDTIEEEVGDEVLVCEVYSPNGSTTHSYPDPDRLWVRVHTRIIDTQ